MNTEGCTGQGCEENGAWHRLHTADWTPDKSMLELELEMNDSLPFKLGLVQLHTSSQKLFSYPLISAQ